MTASTTTTPGPFSIAEINFGNEVRDLANFYEGRIPLAWQDKLQDLLNEIEKEPDDAAD